MLVSIIILIIMIVLLAKGNSKAAAILTGIWAGIYSIMFAVAYSSSEGAIGSTMYTQLLLVWILFAVSGIRAGVTGGK
jgi:hypothetical protein